MKKVTKQSGSDGAKAAADAHDASAATSVAAPDEKRAGQAGSADPTQSSNNPENAGSSDDQPGDAADQSAAEFAGGAQPADEAKPEQEARVDAAALPSRPLEDSIPKPTIDELKDKFMATVPNNDQTKKASDEVTSTMTDAMSEAQNRAKAAFEKGNEAMGELSEFAKGNVEAMVESSKIIASGMQELGRTYAEEAKTAYEQMTADLKELAAIKSPTELFQLQSKIMRRNFDMLVATSSKNTEAMMRLATEAFQPLSGRMNAAADKMSKVS